MIRTICISMIVSLPLFAHMPTKEQTKEHRAMLTFRSLPNCTTLPEGGFAYYFNKDLFPYLEKPLNRDQLATLEGKIQKHLKIPLTKEGFTQASTRRNEMSIDETNYSAIWVRDAVWHYYAISVDDRADAKELLLNLCKFYATKPQQERFIKVIEHPEIADIDKNPNAPMEVPLIRFSRKTLSHHEVNGKPQPWNHMQFDSHGLFLLAVCHALNHEILTPSDFTPEMYDMLALFPAFFQKTNYWHRKDAGPWEEELLYNTSSVGLIAAGLKNFHQALVSQKAFKKGIYNAATKQGRLISYALIPDALDELIKKGEKTVEFNLSLGAEAPDLENSGYHRGADAALLFLCMPEGSLYYNNPEMMQKILTINQGLIGPYGVFRYKLDAYQSLNYWISDDVPSAINGPKTPDLEIFTRFKKGIMPAGQPYEAQWFFDSLFASVYYRLSMLVKQTKLLEYYKREGDKHLKRALGQFTSERSIAANGERLPAMSLPESINTVFDENHLYTPMPSPISPLSWSKASMRLALENAKECHSH